MAVDLFAHPASPPCRAVLMVCKEIGVDINVKPINLSKGEHMTPEFLKVSLEWSFSFF